MPSTYTEYPSEEYSYLAASYVKYIEMAGAQAIPIYYDGDHEYYDSIFTKINGLLIPGGTHDFGDNPYSMNAAYLYNKVIEANENGIHFPVKFI
jgi:gamma-glutamyl hydrolase